MHTNHRKEFINVLSSIKNPQVLDAFMEDILTQKEFSEIVTRWQIIKQLSMGIPQREIAAKLGVSIAKITRGSREWQDASGGFRKVLEKK